MVTMKRVFILYAFACSGLASLMSILSLATQDWIVTDSLKWLGKYNTEQTPTYISYGLFKGYVETKWPADATIDLDVTCDFGDNICAMMCGTEDSRTSVLKRLHKGQFNITTDLAECISQPKSLRHRLQDNEVPTTDSSDTKVSDNFINAGVWITTVIFQILSIVFGCMSSIVAFYNFISNPYHLIFSLMVIYICSAVALFCSIMVMFLWGIMYAVTLRDDVCTVLTISNLLSSDKRSSLGYSYWINIIPILMYIATIIVLFVRQLLVSKDPGQKMIEKENTVDPEIYSY